jgi:hypothetical protein
MNESPPILFCRRSRPRGRVAQRMAIGAQFTGQPVTFGVVKFGEPCP